jgi:uncharacterized protein (DUF2267 family)
MKYEEFIGKVRKRARLASTEEAENATRATLSTLAERLEGNEADDLAAQLPQELANFMLTYGTGRGERYSLDEFFRLVSEREGVALADGEYHARVVIGLLAESVTVGEIDDVRAQLPADFAHLFDVENEGEIPELGTVADVEEENA